MLLSSRWIHPPWPVLLATSQHLRSCDVGYIVKDTQLVKESNTTLSRKMVLVTMRAQAPRAIVSGMALGSF